MPYRVALVCLGNICRSPTAEVVLRARLDEAGLGELIDLRSSGTGDWHVGEPMDRRTAAVLREAGYDPDRHRARHFSEADAEADLILVMDAANLADVRALLPAAEHHRVLLYRTWDPLAAAALSGPAPDVPDPWYGGPAGFAEVLQIVERTSLALVAELRDRVGHPGQGSARG